MLSEEWALQMLSSSLVVAQPACRDWTGAIALGQRRAFFPVEILSPCPHATQKSLYLAREKYSPSSVALGLCI